MKIDLSLYLVTDRGLLRQKSLLDLVKAAVAGGVTCVQIREKKATTRRFIKEAENILFWLKERRIPLIVNDRVDIALAIGADGVHLGQSDMPCAMAKKICGSDMIVGISAESVEDAVVAEKEGADYIGVSPLFSTPTKTDAGPPLGLAGLCEIKKKVKIPVVGIGGINKDNAGAVIRNGADGIAVVSAIVAARDPEKAARELAGIVKDARQPG